MRLLDHRLSRKVHMNGIIVDLLIDRSSLSAWQVLHTGVTLHRKPRQPPSDNQIGGICFDRDAWTFDHIHAILRINSLSDSFPHLETSISCYGVDAITSDISISVMKSQLFISFFERFLVGESRNHSPGTVTAIGNQSDWQCTYLRALDSSNLPSALHRFQSEEV